MLLLNDEIKYLAITRGIKHWGFIGLPSASLAGKFLYRLRDKQPRTPQRFHTASVKHNPGYDRVIDSLSERQILESADNK